jgi:hypothetical protein
MRICRALLVLSPLVLLAGCGNARTPPPTVTRPAQPSGFHTLGYPSSGFALSAPNNWLVQPKSHELVATISSGDAVVAVWRFPRHAKPPTGAKALAKAAQQLIAAARARDPSFELIRSNIQTVDGAPAVELAAFERVGGQRRRVRSVHVFAPDAELVLDEYAPPGAFHAVDHAVFSPVKHSLRLSSA